MAIRCNILDDVVDVTSSDIYKYVAKTSDDRRMNHNFFVHLLSEKEDQKSCKPLRAMLQIVNVFPAGFEFFSMLVTAEKITSFSINVQFLGGILSEMATISSAPLSEYFGSVLEDPAS